MNEKERLTQWMQEKGFDTDTLAAATGDSFSSIYMITKGDRKVNDAFKWRFAVAFGWQEASQVFDVPQSRLAERTYSSILVPAA